MFVCFFTFIFSVNQIAFAINLNVSSYCRFRPKFTFQQLQVIEVIRQSLVTSIELVCPDGWSEAWWAGQGSAQLTWECFEKCANHSVKVNVCVVVGGGGGEYFAISWDFTWLGFQMLWSTRGPIFLCICLGETNGLRIEWTCTLCFPYLGLWETRLHLGFGSKHIHAFHLTEEFGVGLHYFLLLNDKSLGVVV